MHPCTSREKRRQSQDKDNEERQQLKKQRRDLDQLGQIQAQVEAELGHQSLRNQRHQVKGRPG